MWFFLWLKLGCCDLRCAENCIAGYGIFLRPAGGRLGPLAEHGSVLPVEECHEVYGQRVGRARKNLMRCRGQMAKLVRVVASQEMDDEMRGSAAWDECKTLIEALQKDL